MRHWSWLCVLGWSAALAMGQPRVWHPCWGGGAGPPPDALSAPIQPAVADGSAVVPQKLGEGARATGACCDEWTGVCIENVAESACTQGGKSFLLNGTCADFDPACGGGIGACCWADGYCEPTDVWGCVVPPCICMGDLDHNDYVDFGDINPFVLALANPTEYEPAADINEDGVVDFGDINPFIAVMVECSQTLCRCPTMWRYWLGRDVSCVDCVPDGSPGQ